MFGFFEKVISDISEIVAPIAASNQLFLAIQHGRNDECMMLINSACKDFDVTTISESGFGALHVACKYNNRQMVNEIMQRGVSIDFLDRQGNTPLHYACKYGHMDLCKYLIDAGASILAKNVNNQRPYDIAESHVIRQYLLPLQFKAEAAADGGSGSGAGANYDPYMYVTGVEPQGGPVNSNGQNRVELAAATAAAVRPLQCVRQQLGRRRDGEPVFRWGHGTPHMPPRLDRESFHSSRCKSSSSKCSTGHGKGTPSQGTTVRFCACRDQYYC